MDKTLADTIRQKIDDELEYLKERVKYTALQRQVDDFAAGQLYAYEQVLNWMKETE